MSCSLLSLTVHLPEYVLPFIVSVNVPSFLNVILNLSLVIPYLDSVVCSLVSILLAAIAAPAFERRSSDSNTMAGESYDHVPTILLAVACLFDEKIEVRPDITLPVVLP